MKPLLIILFLILMSCKSETRYETSSENDIDKTVIDMWDNFIKLHPEFKNDKLPEAFAFHNNEADANRLANLIVSGHKKAGSNLYFWYQEANANLPKVGTKSIVTDFDGTARAIIEIKKVDTIPFNKISKSYAELDMGTKIEPLKKWRKAHWDFFEMALKESGKKPSEDMLIVCEWFETIWPKKQ